MIRVSAGNRAGSALNRFRDARQLLRHCGFCVLRLQRRYARNKFDRRLMITRRGALVAFATSIMLTAGCCPGRHKLKLHRQQ
jgi:hypothetical protein